MMKHWSRIILTFVLVAVLLPAALVPVQAASTEASSKATDKQLTKLVDKITAYTTAVELGEGKEDSWTEIKLNDKNMISIAGFIRYNYKHDYRFTAGELRDDTKNIFGKSALVNKKKVKGSWVCQSEKTTFDPYMYCGGDFGDVIPKNQIESIELVKNKLYKITASNYYKVYGEKGKEEIGKTVILVKEAKKGYIVKSIKYMAK